MNVSATLAIGGGPVVSAALPDIPTCPICHHAIHAVVQGNGIYGSPEKGMPGNANLQIILRCPRPSCERLFIARYEREMVAPGRSVVGEWEFIEVVPRSHQAKEFPEEISTLSEPFIAIYGQSSSAENVGLDQICGAGYRKALEFLIKDYLKSLAKVAAEKEAIEKEQLAACIANRVSDPRLKSTAARAAWLGNDETHYIRKWTDKDLSDLKKLIDLTVHWISAEILTGELEASMPDPKKGKSHTP